MPEFILDRGNAESAARFAALDAFTRGYVECMFFTSSGMPEDDDLKTAHVGELAQETWDTIEQDCAKFQADNRVMIDEAIDSCKADYDDESAGRDFWYTRNRHGVGYWDRDIENGDALSDAAQTYQERDLYRGDDGLLYLG